MAAILSSDYGERYDQKIQDRLGITDQINKLQGIVGSPQTLGESANAGIASADKAYAQTVNAAHQEAATGIAQAEAAKGSLKDTGQLSTGQQQYYERNYSAAQGKYRSAYDQAVERASATRKQAYSAIYNTLAEQAGNVHSHYSEIMSGLLNSAAGINAIYDFATQQGINTDVLGKVFTTKGAEARKADFAGLTDEQINEALAAMAADKRAKYDDTTRTWTSSTDALGLLEELGLYDETSESGNMLRYMLYNLTTAAGEGSWASTWSEEQRNNYLNWLPGFREDVLNYTAENYAAAEESYKQMKAAKKEEATSSTSFRYAGVGELNKNDLDADKLGKRIHITYNDKRYALTIANQADATTTERIDSLVYNATGSHNAETGAIICDNDKMYIRTTKGWFEMKSTDGWVSGDDYTVLKSNAGNRISIRSNQYDTKDATGKTVLERANTGAQFEVEVLKPGDTKYRKMRLHKVDDSIGADITNPYDGQYIKADDGRLYVYWKTGWFRVGSIYTEAE
nr:MAG TPA: hypothetical protein [Caudoviricetes sp.]